MTDRANAQALRDRPHADVLIIGGGINGIATFRELALQGVDVALVERADYVSGASAASSHMVHGGVRYLENGEFRLVREAVTERNRLLRNAPHLVKPLPTTIPMFKTLSGLLAAPFRLLVTHGAGKPRERGALLIKVGLTIYDTFSRSGGQVPRHRFHARHRSLSEFPQMNHTVRYTATYYDASMPSPERLALDVLHDGIAAQGRAANYVSAVGFADGRVRLRDEAGSSGSGSEFEFAAPVVLNASGSWVDLTNESLGLPTHFMGGTKGSHIVLDNPELRAATRGHEIFFEHSDGRIVLIYPLGDRVMVGTTDIPADPREQQVCTDEEIDYFFELVRHVFPRIEVDRSQIVYTFSGIRPLPHTDDVAPGFVSRDYRIEHTRSGGVSLLSLVGGKWTTFRASAEHLANDTLKLLRARRRVTTSELPIGGGKGYPSTAGSRRKWISVHGAGHDPALVETMLDRYGTRAREVLATLPADTTELVPGYYAEELTHLASHEQVAHLDDVLLRRTGIAFHGEATPKVIEAVARAIAPALGWSDARVGDEIARTQRILRENHPLPR